MNGNRSLLVEPFNGSGQFHKLIHYLAGLGNVEVAQFVYFVLYSRQ